MLRPTRQRKTKDPCEICFLHRERCICADIPSLQTRTRVSLVIHAKEMKRTTNTGLLAARALTNSEVFVRGAGRERLDLSSALNAGYRTLLFYPCAEAIELTPNFTKESLNPDNFPVHLIVPDGNWRQASKVHYRHRELDGVQRVMVRRSAPPTRGLRAESDQDGMATLEAVAHAMALIENEEVGRALLQLYELKLMRTLAGRGAAPANDATHLDPPRAKTEKSKNQR